MFDNLPEDKKIIIFDGVCNLCNSSINYVIDNDNDDHFRFVTLQSDLGLVIQDKLNIDKKSLDSIILYIPNDGYYVRSTAALKIMNDFSGIWKLTQIFYVIPLFIRDYIYNTVAKNRYNWFGKKENCRIPTPELKTKFL
jgi:predicted DCC family thiol-disulfide oxidoreductase YuxK